MSDPQDRMVWTGVPGGRVAGGLAVLRLVIVPRLHGPLAGSELADWPRRLPNIPIEVMLTHDGTTTTITPGRRDAVHPEMWDALLGGLDVRPYAPRTFAGTRVEPTSSHAGDVVRTYAATAKDPATVAVQLATWDREPPQPSQEVPPGPAAALDFHQQVARLREHPTVLRALGLIVELTLPAGALGPAGSLKVGSPGLNSTINPATDYEFDGNLFLPASAGDLSSGMLDLRGADLTGTVTSARWEVTTFDVDGAVAKLREAARGDRSSLPQLRSTGLMLVRRDRQSDFDARHQTAAFTAGIAAGLGLFHATAADLLLGYRIDIRPKDGAWAPLCRRVATYRAGGITLGPQPEEGQVKPYAATGNGDTLQADEVVARWDGWSLVLPRPTLGTAPTPRQSPGPLYWTFELEPRSLPQLRFGHSYEIRARAADLAGGGLEFDDPAADRFMSSLVAYTRFEPVPPPEVSRAELFILSDRGMTVAEFLAANPQYALTADQLTLTVPPTTLALAEQHGMLDGDDAATWAAAQQPTDPASAGVAVHLVLPVPVTDRRPWSGPWPGRSTKTLALAERGPGGQPQLTWSADASVATVSLAQAEQITVELSSYLPDDFLDRFAIRQWLEPGAESTASGGRHPMVTPPRTISLVHAVRKPLRDPAGTLRCAHEPGQTYTALVPSSPLLDLDPPSTAQVQITAAWDEWDDAPRPTPATTTVQSITMHPADQALPPLRHEFGDTKHRVVTYTVTGTTRFRRYFADNEPATAFLASAALAPVVVASSARPIPPVVLGVRPAFGWLFGEPHPGQAEWDSLERTRLGGRLQVELARPWYTTGAGELLAVQCTLGRDPVWSTADPSSPAGTTFHEVWRSGESWYADVELPPVQSYAPFVRLTVARHQPNSLPGLDMSAPVDTDIVAIMPDRMLTVQRQGNALQVRLNGIGPSGPRPNLVQVFMESGTSETAVLTTLDGDPGPTWVRVPGASVSGELNTPLPPLPIPQVPGKLRIYVCEVEQLGPSPSGGELGRRVVFADYVLGFPTPLVGTDPTSPKNPADPL